ncbi:CPBP family intramembrane glutamic endopeptidase [Cytobacillus sp. FJAT-54145]|uniref:CPBP family intramembrane glutamic endopeptidase n=1 Tax=Cytobacillus spartinae TaxID=3299023 RepID=A0ABW6K789_9BACI
MERVVKVQNHPNSFNINQAIMTFSSFSAICAILIIFLINTDIFSIGYFFASKDLSKTILVTSISLLALIIYGVILSALIPSEFIDDTNKTYQNYNLIQIISFMFVVSLFEELFLRGIVQNFLLITLENAWLSIIISTLLFVALHVQYFKKPIMLLNITIPGLVFGWIYYESSNIAVPITVHFLVNVGTTLLFKYNVIKIKP